jgi:hypothetical protein
MLRRIGRARNASPDLVRGDGQRPPLRAGAFHEVALLGNAVGFAGAEAERLLENARALLTPRGLLNLEVVAGPGEVSRYLRRLPPSTLPRLLHAPLRALVGRVEREGFAPLPPRRAYPGTFRRFDPALLAENLTRGGCEVGEVMAVAPALGAEPARLEGIERDPVAWERLLELEEVLGRKTDRLRASAATLVAVRSPGPPTAGLSKPGHPLIHP